LPPNRSFLDSAILPRMIGHARFAPNCFARNDRKTLLSSIA
jgi:hypothetical protein